MSAATVLLADDHPVTRLGLSSVLGADARLKLIGEAVDGDEALEKIVALAPTLALVDLKLPKRSGLQVLEALQPQKLKTRVVLLTGFGSSEDARRARELGAWGFLNKELAQTELLHAMAEVLAGRAVWTIAQREAFKSTAPKASLSPRELEVLRALANGASNKEIAAKLGLSDGTVRIHLSNIFAKLEVGDRTAAVTLGLKLRLIELE